MNTLIAMMGYGYGFGLDPVYLVFMIPGLLLGMYAQFKLSGTYGRYSNIGSSNGLSGFEAAREILDRAGLRDMPVEVVPGHLTDHYDPMRKALFLSHDNYYGRSLAAVGVAAHEAGHALQHKNHYFPLHFRMALVPLTNIAGNASGILIMLGFVLGLMGLVKLGIACFGLLALFQIITLPVEFNASSRAKQQLLNLGLVRQGEEAHGVSRVLSAAAMTYVAAMITTVLTLLYYILRFTGGGRREES
jgi:Zn-dependent membrane protease YugP